ncbi:LANO_0G07052g1_1 [Lachancea nothofagi CBS 11611]|uniref:LANO_0G07052g1_1 n=1 Tax=Lachancea nothofagi CBS 11611 TaxID=1266666 RepID=A0A1G4KHI3_9SACH|nr:LANO_0G07052g1_1 [Lachancea nothofagi CBS 11611]
MDNKRVPRHGISAIYVDQAREAFAQTVRARDPRSPAATMNKPQVAVGHDIATIPRPNRHRCKNPNNPACPHCSAVIIPAPKATLPLEDTPSISIEDWTISTRKKPILNSKELDEWETILGGLTLPEMIFGNSFVRIENEKKGWCLEFNALDALKAVKVEDSGIRVSYAHKWIKSKKEQQRTSELDDNSLEIGQHYDWTYTTNYKGSLASDNPPFTRDDSIELPLDKLTRPDPILFYDDMILFEDELADNGISVVNVKVRVMNERALILSRFFLRVDGVLFRVYDTRVYVEFDENRVVREYKEHENDYNAVLTKQNSGHGRDPKAILRDSNWVAQQLPLVKRECEFLQL